MSLYLGFDCSTQSLSAIVIEIDAHVRRVVFQHALNFDRDFPGYGTAAGVWRGADPADVSSSPVMWAEALDRMMAIVATDANVDVRRIRAISGSAQQHGSVYLNSSAACVWRGLDGTLALAPQIEGTFSRSRSPVWMDETTSAQCAAIERTLGGGDALAQLTGSQAHERFTGPQIRKFFELDVEAYRRTTRIHLVSSYLASLLVGVDAAIDYGDGSGMNLMDLRESRWAAAALDATAPDLAQKLPTLAPSWTLAGPLSRYWQVRYGMPAAQVVAWSGDNPCSLVGTGIVSEGHLAISLGTSDTVFAWTRVPRSSVSHVFASPMGSYMGLVCFRNGSLARERIRDEHALDWHGFSRALEGSPPGNGGAFMLPWFEAEITPHVNTPGVRRFGLEPHDPAVNVRAVVEAQMMAMAIHSTPLSGNIRRITATGGASANAAILRVMADVFGVAVSPLDIGNAACLGAALRAFHADRLSHGDPLPWPAVVKGFTDPGETIEPIPANAAIYTDMKRLYAEAEQRALNTA
jgi:xylulokinase